MKRAGEPSATPKRLILVIIAAVAFGILVSLGVLAASTGINSTRQLVAEMVDNGSRFILGTVPVSVVDGPSAEEYAVYDAVFSTLAGSPTSSRLDDERSTAPHDVPRCLRSALPTTCARVRRRARSLTPS